MNKYKQYKHYYIKKENIKIVKNYLYEVKKTEINDIFLIYLNEKLYNRYQKLSKIIKVNLLSKVDNLLKYKISYFEYQEYLASEDLSKMIDKDIIERLIKLK